MNDFPYNMVDVLRINNISINQNTKNKRIVCPYCASQKIKAKNFTVNLETEKFNCYSCGVSGRGATQFHASLNNISTKDAYHDIMNALGLESDGKVIKRERKEVECYYPEVPQSAIADIDTLNDVYSDMIAYMSLSDKNRNELINRGFSDDEINTLGYVTYPANAAEGYTNDYFDIPKKLLSHGKNLRGIPGFYKTKRTGTWTMMSNKGGVVVPYRNINNKIYGIQIRKDNEVLERNEESGEVENKYGWFSSNNMNEGCKRTSIVHFATSFFWDREKHEYYPDINLKGIKGVVITEGAMKADLAHCISGMPFLAIPGVTNCKEQLIEVLTKLKEKYGLEVVFFAFDMDRVLNINVAEALYDIKKLILNIGIEVKELYWSNLAVMLDKSKEKFDVLDTFIFTPESLRLKLEQREHQILEKTLEKALRIEKKEILVAFKDSKAITDEAKKDYQELSTLCHQRSLKIRPCLWSLRLKGIDDYYANQKRNVTYN